MVRDTQTTPMEVEDISIGVVVSLTGSFAQPYGLPMQRGFELARQEINNLGRVNLTFITLDAESTEAGSVRAVQQLVNRDVPVIVGIAISDYLEDAFPIAQENGVVAFSSISSAPGLSSIGDFVFRAGLAGNILIPSGVMATQEKLGYKRAAVIYDYEIYFTGNEVLKKALQANGVDILTEETFQTGDTDFSQQLTNIMNIEPDVVFIAALAQEMTQIIVQVREIGIPDAVHLIVLDMSRDELQKVGDAAEGAITFAGWSSLSDTPGNATFVENYRATYGIEPELWAAQSYATLYILSNAIANAESTDAVAIRDALVETQDFPTILGNFSFDPDGEAVYAPIVLIAKDSELQPF